MEHFVRVIFEKNNNLNESLDESIFPGYQLFETAQGASVFQIPLPRALDENESNTFAKKLSNYMFEQGFDDFDIEISTDLDEDIIEETYDGDDFFEEYGVMWFNEDQLDEADYQGRKVSLGKPMQGDVKKFKVYVKDPGTGNIKKVNFGDPNMTIKKSYPARRRSFRARHNCDNPGPRTKARYWSCRKW
jgi:hypothetical protein